MTVLGFILYLIVAAVCAWIAEATVPGVIPGGFLTSSVVGIIGGWLGGSLFGSFGPALAGVALVPTIIGSAILILGMALVSRGFSRV